MRHLRPLLVACGALLLATAPAQAELEWVPEGQFYMRYGAPVEGEASQAADANFELVSGRLGTRLLIAPGISARAVAELLSADPSRRTGDLRFGYAEWITGFAGTFRAGQIPLLRDAEEEVVGDPILGPGAATRAGFFYPGGLGASWAAGLPFDLATTSVEVALTLTEGYLASEALAPSPLFEGITGTGPALAGRLAMAFGGGWTGHALGRYGIVQDQQLLVGVSRPFWDLDTVVLAGASVSNPAGLPPSGDVVAMARGRYNLGSLHPTLWRADVVGRVSVDSRNVTRTRTIIPEVAMQDPRTDLRESLAVVYRVTDYTAVALELTELRALAPEATRTLLLGASAGVRF